MSLVTSILTAKIEGNTDTITYFTNEIPNIQETIDSFSPVCNVIDTQIVSIAASIVTIQTEIVGLAASAYAVGCGTTAGALTVYPDTVKNYSYNISTSTYDGDDPYAVTITTLNTGNIGFGTLVVYTQNDSTQIGIGTSFGDIGSCYRSPCTSGDCTGYATSISTKLSQILSLRNQLNELVSSSNKVKTERIDYEIQRFGFKYNAKILTNENTRISLAITAIQNYS